MPRPKVNPIELVVQAIHEAGTSEPGKVSLQIEEIVQRKMANRTAKGKVLFCLYREIERYGIRKYSDVVRLVEKVRRAVS